MATSNVAIGGLGTGLASQIDSNAIITKLVQLEQQPITNLQTQQKAYQTQISTLSSLASDLSGLQSAVQDLATNGVLGLTTSSSNTAFTATPGSGATAGSYTIQVDSLASAAKWRSGGFGSTDVLQAGQLKITIDKVDYLVDVSQGESLATLASDLKAKGAPISAAVLNDGTKSYLSITATQAGYAGSDPTAALAVSFTATAPNEAGLDPSSGAASTAATNASFQIDGLAFTRRTNNVADALPGTTLALKVANKTPEVLQLDNDESATEAKVKKFVDAYNTAMALVQSNLAVSDTTDRSTTLAGDPTVRGLQSSLQSIVSAVVGQGNVRSLADLGVITERDGSLSIDSSTLAAAIARDPAAVNTVFADPAAGLSKQISDLVDTYIMPSTGLLSLKQTGLQSQITDLDDQIATKQAYVQSYQESLVAQFSAMDSLVSSMENIKSYLTALSNTKSSSS